MSIADKITSIETHLEADYEGLENIGADLTGINKNIQNIRTCLDTIYSNLPKVTGTDGTEVTLTPTLKGKLNIQEKGNSTQESTTGKQLVNKDFTPLAVLTASGITKSALDTGCKVTYSSGSQVTNNKFIGYIIGDVSSYVGKTVRVKANFTASASNTPQVVLGVCNSEGGSRSTFVQLTTSGNTASATIPSSTSTYLFIYLFANAGGTISQGDYADFTDLIVTIDNEDMSYEKYTRRNSLTKSRVSTEC